MYCYYCAALSGVPSEFTEMLNGTVLPFLKKRFTLKPRLYNLFNTIGKSESEVQRIVLPIFHKYKKVSWGITAHHLIISLSVWAELHYKNQFDAVCRQLRAGLKNICFSEGAATLQETVISTLKKKRLSVAIAESCTGGLILDKLTDVPGASEVLMEGVVSYSNDSKIRRLGVSEKKLAEYGAVSEQVAAEMAQRIRNSAAADFGVSTTGIAGPTGATAKKPIGLVYIAVASRKGVKVKRFTFTGNRTDIKNRASNAALAMLLAAL